MLRSSPFALTITAEYAKTNTAYHLIYGRYVRLRNGYLSIKRQRVSKIAYIIIFIAVIHDLFPQFIVCAIFNKQNIHTVLFADIKIFNKILSILPIIFAKGFIIEIY